MPTSQVEHKKHIQEKFTNQLIIDDTQKKQYLTYNEIRTSEKFISQYT